MPVRLRFATTADVEELLELWQVAAENDSRPVDTAEAVEALLARDAEGCTVAELDGRVAAYARFTRTWLDDLYVAPGAQRDGLGGALLELVKSLRPQGFGLWVFESNLPARQFYARHGLVEVERTDGSANEEREPDIRMIWDPSD